MFKFPKSNNGTFLKAGNMQSKTASPISANPTRTPSVYIPKSDSKPSTDPAATSTNSYKRKLTKYEELANLSEDRPEMIALTNFSPILTDDQSKTAYGKLFDLYVETLRQMDASSQFAMNSEENKNIIKNNNKEFKNQISTLRNRLNELNNILKMLAVANKNIDVHNSIYKFSPTELVSRLFEGSQRKTKKEDLDFIASKLPEVLTLESSLADALMSTISTTKNYSSTKLWIMCVNELSKLVKTHSKKSLSSKSLEEKESSIKGQIPDVVDSGKDRMSLSSIQKNASIPINLVVVPTFQTTISDSEQKKLEEAQKELNDVGVSLEIPQGVKDKKVNEPKLKSDIANLVINLYESMSYIDDVVARNLKNQNYAGPIIVYLLSKELRHSSCFDQNFQFLKNFRSIGTSVINSENYIEKIFGPQQKSFDVFKIASKDANINAFSLFDLSYSRHFEDNSKLVLTFEENDYSNMSTNLVPGGRYFFDSESLFSNISQKSINLSRLFEISREIERLDTGFFEIISNFGFLPIDDSLFETLKNGDFQKPSFVSFNPINFLQNIINELVDGNGNSKTYDFANVESDLEVYTQKDRGITAILAKAGEGSYLGRNLRASLLISAIEMVEETTNVGINDESLLQILLRDSKNVPTELLAQITNDRSEFSKYLSAYFIDDVFKETESARKLSLSSQYESKEVISRIPCKYDDARDLGNSLRKNKLFLTIVNILKDVKSAFLNYGTQNNRTIFSSLDISTIIVLMFSAICQMVKSFSDNKLVAINGFQDFTTSYSNTINPNSKFFSLKAEEQNFLSSIGASFYQLVLYVDSVPSNHAIKQQEALSIVEDEVKTLTSLMFSVTNFLDTFNEKIQTIYNTINKFNKEAIAYLLSYIETTEKLSILMREQQLMLLLSSVEDVYQNFQTFSENFITEETDPDMILATKYLKSLHYSPQMTSLLERFLSDSEFTETKGYNKKIATVGIPQGLLKGLLKNPLMADSNKHNDIIKISIYKIDLFNNDIVYKPKEFLFEASRFPTRVYSSIKPISTDVRGIADIANAVPTRNYSLFTSLNLIDTGNSTYWDDNTSSFGEEYNFLTGKEKNEIIENHITSFLLENYIKLVTGIDMGDVQFNLTSEEAAALAEYNKQVNSTAASNINREANSLPSKDSRPSNKSSIKVLGNAGAGQSAKNILASSFVTKKFQSGALEKLILADVLIPNSNLYIKNLVQPKKFDRVFNIIFDPEFEVDYEKTTSTQSSASKLEFLIKNAKTIRLKNHPNSYVDVDKSFENPSLDAFFAVVETHAEPFVIDQRLLTSIQKSENSQESARKQQDKKLTVKTSNKKS
jgi:hypothetical protein